MSTHKHIDTICIVIVVFTLLLTVLFMNGKALGIAVIASEENSDELFTANDLDADWDASGATRITLSDDGSKVSGNGAYVNAGDVYIVYAGKYVLSGELSDGSVIINADGDDKIWLLLDGVSIHCEDDAAIRVEQADKVFMTLKEGTESTISSGASYNADVVSAGVDGTIYSRDDLTINGTGALSVTAEYQHGIVCNDDLVVTGGTISVTAAQDAIHANDSVRIREAGITLTAGDDGITASNDDETSFFYMESGGLSIPSCYEGIEAIQITIAGGTIDIVPTDDGINANGYGENSAIYITGGDITITNENGRDADGLDSNKDIFISGGRLFISVADSGGSCAIDYGSENGGVCEISGGTVLACGSNTMAESFDSTSTQGFLMYTTSGAAGTNVTVKDADGNELISETIPCGFSSILVSTPEMSIGDTCVLSVGGAETELTIDNSSVSGFGGFGGRGNAAGGGFGMFGGKGGDPAGGRGTAQESGEQPDVTEDGTDGFPGTVSAGSWSETAVNESDLPEGMTGNRVSGPAGAGAGMPAGMEPPEMPEDADAGGTAPDLPQGGSDGEAPELPQDDTGDANNATPQPDASQGDQAFPDRFDRGNMQQGDRNMWNMQNQGGNGQTGTDSVSVSPESILMVGVSALVLLIGCLVALLYKRRG